MDLDFIVRNSVKDALWNSQIHTSVFSKQSIQYFDHMYIKWIDVFPDITIILLTPMYWKLLRLLQFDYGNGGWARKLMMLWSQLLNVLHFSWFPMRGTLVPVPFGVFPVLMATSIKYWEDSKERNLPVTCLEKNRIPFLGRAQEYRKKENIIKPYSWLI